MEQTQEEIYNENNKPVLKLTGIDGNAFVILGRAQQVARRAGMPKEIIDEFRNKAMSGDYNNLLRVCMEYFDVE